MLLVTRDGKILDPSLYTFENNIFTSDESYLTISCYVDGVTFNTRSHCTFNAQSHCIFNTRSYCVFNTQSYCIFNTWNHCTFSTLSYCNFNTGSYCNFKTDASCNFNTKSNCVFMVKFECAFKTASYCVLLYESDKTYREFLDDGYFIIKKSKGFIPIEVELFEVMETMALFENEKGER